MNLSKFLPLRRDVSPLILLISLVSGMWAQDITKGSIAGVVHDATGSVVAGTKIDLSGPFGQKTTTTDSTGSYVFANLLVGSGYSVTATKAGFGLSKSTDISVGVNQRTTVDIRIEVGTTAQSVDVTDTGAQAIDLNTTTVGANLDESLYKNVSVGRNLSAVINMSPGVSGGGGTGDANPSINGASGLENQYIINGANVTDPGYGGFGTYTLNFGSLGSGVNFDFIQEVQVKSGGFEAQYGEALGGVVNIITKSGGNTFHGDLYSYFQPHSLEATRPDANAFTSTQTTRIAGAGRYDFGGDLGGYAIKDKLFWYGGFNPNYSQSFRASPAPFANRALGTVDVQTRTLNYAAKIDWNISSAHQLEGSVFGDPATLPSTFARVGSIASNDNLRQSGLDYGTRTWTGRYNGSFGPKFLVTANYSDYFSSFTESPKFNGYQITDNTQVEEQPKVGTAITYNGLGSLQDTVAKNHQFAITATYLATFFGGHTLDFGYQYENVPYDISNRYSGPDFVLPNDPALKAGAGQTVHGAAFIREHQGGVVTNPIVLRMTRGNYSSPTIVTLTTYNSGFIQDSWVIGKRLTIKPGIRFEQQSMAGTSSHYVFSHNWAPRVGLIYDPTGKRKSKFFANWGRFYEKVPSDISVRAFSFESSVIGELYKDPGVGKAPDVSTASYIPGGRITSQGGPDALTLINPGTRAQYQDEIVGGYEHEFGGGFTFSGRFVYRELKRILEDISGINVTQALAGSNQQYVISNPSASLDIFKNGFACGSGPTCDPNTHFTLGGGDLGPDGHTDGFSNPSRVYKAMELIVSKRLSANFQLYASYRLSKLDGNFEGSFRNDNGQSDPNISSLFDFTNTDGLLGFQQAAGVLPNNRTNQAKIYANYQWKAFNFGVSWNIVSGTPLTPLAAHPAYQNAGEIPITPRGSLGNTPLTFPLDLHADYTYKLGEKKRLKFVADLFNVGNQTRLTAVNTWTQLNGGAPANADGSPNLITINNPDYLKPGTNVFAYPYQVPFFARLAARFEF
jgi:hypothetical protein